jgi:hypothetical protein
MKTQSGTLALAGQVSQWITSTWTAVEILMPKTIELPGKRLKTDSNASQTQLNRRILQISDLVESHPFWLQFQIV